MLFTEHNCPFRLMLNHSLKAAGVRLESALEVGSLEAVKQCAVAGRGLAILPRIAVLPELSQHLLISVPCVGVELRAYTQMIRAKARWTLPALSALWDLANQAFGSVLTH
jgi:DNA-binding transcriptional LysR family regulator